MKSLLYIGNKVSKHGYSVTNIETLGKLLEAHYTLYYASEKKDKLLRMVDMVRVFLKVKNKVDFVIIDTYSTLYFYSALVISQLARLYNKKYIPILHGGNLPQRIQKSPFWSRLIFKNSIINVAPSHYLKSEFEKKGYEVSFIPNNIEIERYTFKKRVQVKPRLLFVRSFAEIYNPTMAVKVLYELLKNYPEASLCMVGPDKDGSLEETQRLAQSLGVYDKVTFTGKLEKEAWIKLSEDYDIFINPTNFDNTPVSVMEAMALGLPVVSTNAGGLPFLLNDGKDALLIDKNDIDGMVEKITSLIENPEMSLEQSIQARRKVEQFDWEVVKKQWFKIFNA